MAQTTYNWGGGTGNWATPTNWSPNGVPTSTDDEAEINSGTAEYDAGMITALGSLRLGQISSGPGTLNLTGGYFGAQEVQIGQPSVGYGGILNLAGGTFHGQYVGIDQGQINIYDGQFTAYWLRGTSGSGSKVSNSLNIYGSKALIYAEHLCFGDAKSPLSVNFMLDSDGASTIHADRIGQLERDVNVDIPGFLSLKTDSITLFDWTGGAASINVIDNSPFWFTAIRNSNSITLDMAVYHETWDITGSFAVGSTQPGYDPRGLVSGALYVSGTAVPLQAVFYNLNGDLAPLLVDYLNNTAVETGVQFSMINDTTLLLTGDYLNGDGYAWFGWDLDPFNAANGYPNVKLQVFNLSGSGTDPTEGEIGVPEPATWALMLLGGVAMVGMRRRRRKLM